MLMPNLVVSVQPGIKPLDACINSPASLEKIAQPFGHARISLTSFMLAHGLAIKTVLRAPGRIRWQFAMLYRFLNHQPGQAL